MPELLLGLCNTDDEIQDIRSGLRILRIYEDPIYSVYPGDGELPEAV